jgi:hypothetical protein
MNERSKRIGLASVVVVVLIVIGIYYLRSVRRPLSDRATDLVQAMVRGDAGALMACATTREIETGKLTQDKLQKVLDHLLLPYEHSKQLSASPDTQDDSGDVHGMSIAAISTVNGVGSHVGWDVYETPEGPKSPILEQVLTNAWLLRFAQKDGKDMPRGELFRATLAGIAADRSFLVSNGLEGITPIEPEKHFNSWDEVQGNCKKILETLAKN